MKTNQSELSKEISKLGIKITSKYLGEGSEKTDRPYKYWSYDNWLCTLEFEGRKESFSYKTGLGHRKNNKPQNPDVADVVYSIVSDWDAGSMPFEEFCDNFGYDNDSIKALNTYLAMPSMV